VWTFMRAQSNQVEPQQALGRESPTSSMSITKSNPAARWAGVRSYTSTAKPSRIQTWRHDLAEQTSPPRASLQAWMWRPRGLGFRRALACRGKVRVTGQALRALAPD
jgi:hypothetical protein